jgi:N-acetylneuraminate synthase
MSIYTIAEIGINHNGDLNICKQLISEANKAGFNAVKFQKRDINLVYTKSFLDSFRESPWGNTQREQKLGLEFNNEQYEEINKYCKELEIDWFASAWDLRSQDFLWRFDCKYNKVASAMIVFVELLEKIAKEKKHTFISTGMATYSEIQSAVDIFRSENCSFELMHTISTYPMESKNANLKMINTLEDKFKCNVGYSGHESGLAESYAAAALGISSLERHITLDRSMYGSDQSASLEPAGFNQLIGAIRKIETALGDGERKNIEEEIAIAKNLRQHLQTQGEITEGK